MSIDNLSKLKNCADIICGQHLAPDEQSETGIPYLTGPADFTNRVAVPTRFAISSKATSLPGDVLLTVKGTVGRINLAPAFEVVIGRQLFAIRPQTNKLDTLFLFYVLQFNLSSLRDSIKATTVPGIGKEDVESLAIPLPPLDEQRRIVARIDALAAKIEEARGLRRGAGEEAEAFVNSVARKLIEGSSDEITELRSWLDEKREGIKTGPFGAQLSSTDFVDSGIPILTIGNVQYNGLKLDDLKHISYEKAQLLEPYKVKAGDILFARMGTVGRCCIVPEEAEGWLYNYHIIRVAVDTTEVASRYIHWTIRASADVEAYLTEKIRGATREGVNSSIVGGLPCRIPSFEEQRRIVVYLDDLQAKADALKRLQAEAAAELEALLPSVLDQAFRGAL